MGSIEALMPFIPSHRLRAFVVVLALAFGLVGQTFAPAAMAMASGTTPMAATAIADASMSPTDICPGCASIDHSKGMLSDCSVGLCSAVVAILPAGNKAMATRFVGVFVSVAESAGRGITIPPAVGPPRLLHLT
jgi:hypothetical protein